jgi:uncharacterized RDD family membrane protein YckC
MVAVNENTYILVINGAPRGPFSLEQIKAFAIKPGDFLKTPAMDDYKEAHEIPEICELLGFKQVSFTPQYFAGFDQRLMAAALDWFFVSGACILAAFIATLFIEDKALRMSVFFGQLLFIPVVKFVYQVITEASAKQGTYGKQILNIKVCDLNGKRISVGRAVGRNFAKIFSVAPLFIGYLFSFFTKRQQCLHDMVAETLVIKDRLF